MINKIISWGLEILLPMGILIGVSMVLRSVIFTNGFDSVKYALWFGLLTSLQIKGYRNILKYKEEK